MINLGFIALEYKLNPTFKTWFDTTVKAGIEQIERRAYKNGDKEKQNK